MACGCIKRQQWLVRQLCRANPDSTLCKKAKERLAKMEGKSQ